ncbi:MAG: GNAT family N-acetyltransferase [Geminicoccaceae bacterium]
MAEPSEGAVLGSLLSWTGARCPERRTLEGRRVRLVPLDAAHHAPGLFHCSHGSKEDALWTYLSVGPFGSPEAMNRWLEQMSASQDPLFLTVIGSDDEPAGMVSFMRIDPPMGVIEIGNIWFAPLLQRTTAATEVIFLMIDYVFTELGYRRLEWKCNALNTPSRRAADRFGFTFEGVFRQHQVVKGRNRDTAWYALVDHEWPRLRGCFERWLADDNFDEQGYQKSSLRSLIAASLEP